MVNCATVYVELITEDVNNTYKTEELFSRNYLTQADMAGKSELLTKTHICSIDLSHIPATGPAVKVKIRLWHKNMNGKQGYYFEGAILEPDSSKGERFEKIMQKVGGSDNK